MALSKLVIYVVMACATLCQVKVLNAFTMGTHNNPSFPTSIETHKTMAKCALDRSAHAYLRAKNPQIGEPGPCGSDGIWNDLVSATSRLSIGISEYKKVRDLLWQSCVDVDAKYDFYSRYHFDGETLTAGNNMVITNTRTSRDLLTANQLMESRKLVGEMLHTVQDFYSHSNWVELGNTSPLDNLGVSQELGDLAGPTEATCMRCFRDAVGYCYDNIDYDIIDNGKLMSGYYTKQDSVKPPGVTKCSHGGYLDSGDSDGGINKDAVNEPGKLELSPHGYLHFDAATLAIESSVRYLSNFWDMVGYDNYGRFLAFDQRTSTIVVTIDTTGSMRNEIDACIEAATQLALTFSASASQPSYILSPFNDPGYGPATFFDNVTLFVEELKKLDARNGSDPPEMSMSGILLGANAVRQPGGVMFVFTDAPAKDAQLESQVVSLLKEKQLIVNFVITGNTASSDLDLYRRVASSSGGQLLIVLDEKQIVDVTLNLFNVTFVNLVADPTTELVEMMYAKSDTPVDSTSTFDVATDSTVKQMSVVIATDSNVSPQLSITAETTSRSARFGASTKLEVPVDFNVAYSDATKSIVEIRSPPAATLKIQGIFSGSSTYSLSVTAAATFNVALRFMRDTPIGLAPVLSGEPLIGQMLWAYVEVESASYNVQRMVLVDDKSNSIKSVRAQRLASDPLAFAAQFTVPLSTFRVRVEGSNSDTGDAFGRLIPSQFTGTAAYLQLNQGESSFPLFPNSSRTISLTLTNLGSERTYELSANGVSSTFTRSISPQSVSLQLNETATLSLTISAPQDASVGSVDTITILAKAVAGGSDSNNMIVTALVDDPERDLTAPRLTVASSNVRVCAENGHLGCGETRWTATVNALDSESGLRQFYVRNLANSDVTQLGVTVQYSPSLIAGTKEPVTAAMSAPCCVEYLTFVATDSGGNFNQVSFNSSFSKNAASGLKLKPALLLLALPLFLFARV